MAMTPTPRTPDIPPLSPWPDYATDEDAFNEACAYLATSIGINKEELSTSSKRYVPWADRVGKAASELVEQYAPGAPQAAKNEAVIRLAGALYDSDFGGIEQDTTGPISTTYVVNHASMFRHSGAAMLLSRWRVRRAGSIG